MPTQSVNSLTVRLYQGRRWGRQSWRWKAVARNGKVIATSHEAYANRSDALSAVYLLFSHHTTAYLWQPDATTTVLRDAYDLPPTADERAMGGFA